MAVDFDDIRNALVEAIKDNAADMLAGLADIETVVTASLKDTLSEVFTTIIDNADDEETQADENGYEAGESGADNEAEEDQRRADWIAGFVQALSLIRDGLSDVENL